MKLINILQAHMSSPGDDGERKTVMFLTPSPGSSQTSGPGAGSQDEKWSGNVAGDPEENWGQKGLAGQDQGVGRERWSPPAKLDPPPLPPPISVDRLDFSVRRGCFEPSRNCYVLTSGASTVPSFKLQTTSIICACSLLSRHG